MFGLEEKTEEKTNSRLKDGDAVVLKDINLSFGEKEVLKGLSLRVKKGDIVAIMGPSGCGKSTLTKVIIGLLKPDSGEVEVCSDKIALAFQNGALFTSLSLEENIDVVLSHNTDLDKKARRERVKEVLSMVGLENDMEAYPGELSGGMVKRAGIARAISIEPDIMIYDEPSAGLDPILATKLDMDLKEINDKLDMTTLVVTHELTSVKAMADQVVLLFDGKVVFDGTADEFFNGDNEYAVQFREGSQEGPLVKDAPAAKGR